MKSFPLTTAALLLLASTPVLAQPAAKGKNRVQAYIGAMAFDEQTGVLQDGSGDPVEIDFANLLNIGIDAETPMGTRDTGVEWGINAGASVGWRGSDTRYSGSVGGGGANIEFRVDNEMLLVEGHIGPYLRAHIGERLDLYIGAGPAIVFAELDADQDDEDDATTRGDIVLGDGDDSDVVLGLHARAGLEFDLGEGRQWGVGVKYLAADMDFNNTVGKFDLAGFSVLITYSAWY